MQTTNDSHQSIAPSIADSPKALDGGAIVHDVMHRYPATTAVFDAFGIHTCCGGTASVAEAAVRDGADADALLAALRRVISPANTAA